MRFLCFAFLALFTAVVVAFAVYNHDSVTLKFWEYSWSAPMSAVLGVVYVLGMVSGWTLLRLVRRSAGSVMHSVETQFTRQKS